MGIFDRTTKLYWRRRLRKSRRQVEDLGVQAEEQIERNFFGRINHLWPVKRFAGTWVLLIFVLITGVALQTYALGGYYLKPVPVAGGIYTEGILGNFTNANPLYASGNVDSSVSRLLFASLFKYNAHDKLVGDLATGWSVSPNGMQYTVTLKQGLVWQDGAPLTSADVVFTYKTLQNPDAQSPYQGDWANVDVSAPNSQTVIFKLPNPLTSFPYSLTNGIVPKHILQRIPVDELRSANFNTIDPVGSGPFKLKTFEVIGSTPQTREERIELVPSKTYYGGTPQISRFIIRAIHNRGRLIQDFKNKELTAAVGLDELPSSLTHDATAHQYSIPLTAEVGVFFKTTEAPFTDLKVRQALLYAANPQAVIQGLGYPVIPADEPILRSQLGYNAKYEELQNQPKKAAQLLTQAGWILRKDGYRYKDGQRLGFTLVSENTSDYEYVTQVLQGEWRRVGVDVHVVLQDTATFQYTISQHSYDAILDGISIGVDPDVFVYWDSSQAAAYSHPWLNLSEYQSKTADSSLENARIRANPLLRAIKYRPFLQAWQHDAPALMLYQPRFLYLTNQKVYNFSPKLMNTGVDRYSNVQNWMINVGEELKTQ